MPHGLVVFARIGGPHRLILPVLVGLALAGTSAEASPTCLLSLCAAALSLALLRHWFTQPESERALRSSLVLAGAAALFTGALLGLAMLAGWQPVLPFAAMAAIITVFRVLLQRRSVPVELESFLAEGLAGTVLGFLAAGGADPAGAVASGSMVLSLLQLGLLLGLLAVISTWAVMTHEPLRVFSGVPTLASRQWSLLLLLVLATCVLLLLVFLLPVEFTPEQRLLVVSTATVPVMVGWLSLADPRPDWRARRVRVVTLASVYSLEVMMVVVLLFT